MIEPDTDSSYTWFDHNREADGEHVGYIGITTDGEFVPCDLLRRRRGQAQELSDAEELLDRIGLSVLMEQFTLHRPDQQPCRVGVTELTRDSITVSPVLTDLNPGTAADLDLAARWTLPLPTDQLAPIDL